MKSVDLVHEGNDTALRADFEMYAHPIEGTTHWFLRLPKLQGMVSDTGSQVDSVGEV